ncbi:MerR family transcriptional regulator [Metabacillus malikii]|uniref:DNA-binding transcriptional MerR regulator n=1 Tax=Metabacillus malikii TaxID=1504265 RepID=A0ABT9ZD59_9BACI|nr:MerR family transcriptional regulator [Metabacillus malikii]MDQ0229761.1 DNA-binding transcriptional MerR regulator [Metabacillus malikii]
MYKIGELAKKVNISKRTIDYYTQIGLLQVETTSAANYRMYSDKTIDDLRFIELCKSMNMSLQDIKERIELRHSKNAQRRKDETCIKHAKLLATHMKQLDTEIKELKPIIENLNEDSKAEVAQHITKETKALMQSLMLFMK